jgi:hypothetical protein
MPMSELTVFLGPASTSTTHALARRLGLAVVLLALVALIGCGGAPAQPVPTVAGMELKADAAAPQPRARGRSARHTQGSGRGRLPDMGPRSPRSPSWP